MFFSIALIILEFAVGILIFDFFDPKKKFSLLEKFIVSIFVGFLVSNFLIFIFAISSGSFLLGIIVFTFFSFLFSILFFKRIYGFFQELLFFLKQYKWFSSKNVWIAILLAILVLYFFFINLILFEDQDGNLRSYLIGWGDNAFHISLIERFSTAHPFNLEHPILGGANLTYPFMSDFISAVFKKIGAGMIFSFRFPVLLFGFLFILLIFIFSSQFLKSKNFAMLALIFILFGSGFGFTVFFDDLRQYYSSNNNEGIIKFLKSPPHEYTHLDEKTGGKEPEKNTNDNIVWIVPVISFLSHQKSFSLGLAAFAFILLGLFYYGKKKEFWRFGLIAGLLPLCHSHSFLALFLFLFALFWFYISNWKSWLKFGLLTALISIPQLFYLNTGGSKTNFKPWFGWMACGDHSSSCSVFSFWMKNFGIVFLLWLAALVFTVVSRKNLNFAAASVVLFIIPNLILFQPWSFDNNKIIFFWWIIAIIFCITPFLSYLWHKGILMKSLVVFLVFFGVLAGTIDFSSRFFLDKQTKFFGYADASESNQRIADWIISNAGENDRFLTVPSVDPTPLFLAGRPVYLGYEGWLWSHGLDYFKNKANTELILAGDLEIACKEKINYIILNDGLRSYYASLNENILRFKTKNVFPEILKIICN